MGSIWRNGQACYPRRYRENGTTSLRSSKKAEIRPNGFLNTEMCEQTTNSHNFLNMAVDCLKTVNVSLQKVVYLCFQRLFYNFLSDSRQK